jgi:ATP-dependent Zn protease
MLASRTDIIAAHEAGHAVVSRLLGVSVVRASAADDPSVRTKVRYLRSSTADYAKALQALIIIDLAGALAETQVGKAADEGASQTDERTAFSRMLRIVLDENNLEDDELDDGLRREARARVERLRRRAAALVEQNMPAIERVAAALGEGRELTGDEIDALVRLNV